MRYLLALVSLALAIWLGAAFALPDPPIVAAPLETLATDEPINICTQHPMICPLEANTWPGDPGAWLYTAKRWQWMSFTPNDPVKTIWQSSEPYKGSNPAYQSYRENHYTDYTNTPDLYPLVPGTPPVIYDWELWIPTNGNYKLHRYGRPNEQESFFVGTPDCFSGIYYAAVDHTRPYAMTPMSVIRGNNCVAGGYNNAHLIEEWDAPLSPTRIARCDNPATGVPAAESPRGNLICKASPHVGIVYQGYVWAPGSPPFDRLDIGCEVTLYAWGWSYPWQPASGQDYQAWFRNGELRLSMWINLGAVAANVMPAPDDRTWWSNACESAWSSITNYTYNGIYRIGATIYTDTLILPLVSASTATPAGGILNVPTEGVTLSFGPNVFTQTTVVSHTAWLRNELLPPPAGLIGVNGFYTVQAANPLTGQAVVPGLPYSVTISYDDTARGPILEQTLALYFWDGRKWQSEPSSLVNPETNVLTASPDRLGTWAIFGETRRTFLPGVVRPGSQ